MHLLHASLATASLILGLLAPQDPEVSLSFQRDSMTLNGRKMPILEVKLHFLGERADAAVAKGLVAVEKLRVNGKKASAYKNPFRFESEHKEIYRGLFDNPDHGFQASFQILEDKRPAKVLNLVQGKIPILIGGTRETLLLKPQAGKKAKKIKHSTLKKAKVTVESWLSEVSVLDFEFIPSEEVEIVDVDWEGDVHRQFWWARGGPRGWQGTIGKSEAKMAKESQLRITVRNKGENQTTEVILKGLKGKKEKSEIEDAALAEAGMRATLQARSYPVLHTRVIAPPFTVFDCKVNQGEEPADVRSFGLDQNQQVSTYDWTLPQAPDAETKISLEVLYGAKWEEMKFSLKDVEVLEVKKE
ncbi:MAG: hypothetical protein DWQ01_19550 [Planctomycetota bacterium]|nr:MAG: hypothetical protein DWQ01_19550 [Planctomycetota bacterium]